jgi:small-conductance mechanosensitive channel
LIFVLGFLGIDASGLIAALGISGFALAFAFRNLIKDILGSFLIVFESPLRIGDYVLIDKHHGIIRKIGFLRTSIRTPDGHEVVIPNSKLVDNIFTNYRSGHNRIFKFSIVVSDPKSFPEGFDDNVTAILKDNKKVPLVAGIEWHVESYSPEELTIVCFVKAGGVEHDRIDEHANVLSQYLFKAAKKMYTKGGVTVKQDLEAIRDFD